MEKNIKEKIVMSSCKDCQFYDKFPQTCKHDRAVIPKPDVKGNYYYYPVAFMRNYDFLCGGKARFFTPKQRFWGRVFGGAIAWRNQPKVS